jgi:hypothetical protein
MIDDRRSPIWVLVLVALLHAELWAAAALAVFLLMPSLQNTAQAFNMKLPYMAEYLATVALGFGQWPILFALLPAIDAAILFALHRAFPSRLARIAWSVFVAGVILFLLLWVGAAHGFTLHKLREAFLGPAPPPWHLHPGAP